jgi:CRISPR/Cas system-associated protein Cas7 (RAMP superfamily)
MNNEYNSECQKRELDEIETSLNQLSVQEYERNTPVIVNVLQQSLDRIGESISKNSQYWENFEQFKRLKDALEALEPKLREARPIN